MFDGLDEIVLEARTVFGQKSSVELERDLVAKDLSQLGDHGKEAIGSAIQRQRWSNPTETLSTTVTAAVALALGMHPGSASTTEHNARAMSFVTKPHHTVRSAANGYVRRPDPSFPSSCLSLEAGLIRLLRVRPRAAA